MIFQKNSKIIFMGDSVTEQLRAMPVGEGIFDDAYGKSYVNLIRGLIACSYPEYNLRLVNMGVGGNTIRNLKTRWQSDVIDLNPDWVSIMIGVNDVWRQFDSPLITENHVLLNEYKQTLIELIEITKPKVQGIILMTPFFIEPRKDDPMRNMVDKYSTIVKDAAEKYDLVFVDVQKQMDKLTKHMPTASISWDRVHPNIMGHMTIAKSFMDEIGKS